MKKHHSDEAPPALGPYSQAVSCDGWLFTSGQLGIDPHSGDLVPGGPEAETRQALRNLLAVLHTAGTDFGQVVKVTVYLRDLADFSLVNEIYAEALGSHCPARSTLQAAALPLGAAVEIEMIARLAPDPDG